MNDCLNCKNRKLGCHSTCERYAKAAEKRREISEMRMKNGEYYEYVKGRKPTRRRKDTEK